MTYKVIGLMSCSSLDGLDIAYVHLTEQRGQWSFELKEAECVPYSAEWVERLKDISRLSAMDFLALDVEYGKLLAAMVQDFREKHGLDYGIDFIASHGHTMAHDPIKGITCQIGSGSTLAAATGISVISDLRATDVALGGQGAPIVPIGDKLLFPEYDYWLNLGGIANITLKDETGLRAFDICACNQVLNQLAERAGKEYDDGGEIARSGKLIPEVFMQLDQQVFYQLPAPKSLSNVAALGLGDAVLGNSTNAVEDLLHTYTRHIAQQIAAVVKKHRSAVSGRLLVTGGGALNVFLVEMINEELVPYGVEVVVPDREVIQYKEAIVMALIGALKWRNEVNVLASVTGALRDSIGGVLWSAA